MGGGSSGEALVAHAIGLIEAGYCHTMVIFRSMNGRSGRRMGGQVPGGPIPVAVAEGDNQFNMGWGWTTPAQRFGMTAMRYLRDTGCTTRAFAEIAVAHRRHATLNPKAIHRGGGAADHRRVRGNGSLRGRDNRARRRPRGELAGCGKTNTEGRGLMPKLSTLHKRWLPCSIFSPSGRDNPPDRSPGAGARLRKSVFP